MTLGFPTNAEPSAGIFVLRQMQALQRLGHTLSALRVVPIAPPFGARWQRYRDIPDDDIIEGVPVRALRAFVPPRMLAMDVVREQVSRRIAAEIQRTGAEVMHAQFLIPTGRYAVSHGIPTIVTAHGSDAYDWPWKRRDLLRAAKATVRSATATAAVSEFIAERLRALGATDVDVIFNGADAAIFAPRDRARARAQLDLPARRNIIVYAGRLHRDKGVFDLAAACARLRSLQPFLLIAGGGPERGALADLLAANAVESRFAGPLGQTDLAAAYAAADVVVLPSYREGLPAVICEAMLAGRAVVATPVGGIPEIVQDGVTGQLVPMGDAPALADALRRTLEDLARKTSYERAAAAFAAEHLTWQGNALAYEALYRRCIEGR